MNATRTEPRVHCLKRPMQGAYVPAASTTPAHLAQVFEAERARLASIARPRRKRRAPAEPAQAAQASLLLVATA